MNAVQIVLVGLNCESQIWAECSKKTGTSRKDAGMGVNERSKQIARYSGVGGASEKHGPCRVSILVWGSGSSKPG